MAVDALALPARYARSELIGHGGMAQIYAAEDAELGRRVAVKVLDERFRDDPEIRERFTREALAAARLSGHPHIATIFDVGEEDGRPFIVMELAEGGSVAERTADASIWPGQALAWLEQAASALDAAHAEGIVHRDVKPANLLLDERDEIKVTDFGIALVLDEATTATATGTVLGTAGYLAPEQAAGGRATPASDEYGLAVVAYELLAGKRPFARANAAAEAAAHLHEPVPPPSETSTLPPAVDAVFARALAKDPAYRYESAQAFVADLSAALSGGAVTTATAVTQVSRPKPRSLGPLARRSVLPAAATVLLLSGGALAAVWLTHGGHTGPPPAPASPKRQHVTPPPPAPVVHVPPPGHGHGRGKAKGHHKPPKAPKPKKEHHISPAPPPTTAVTITAATTTEATTTEETTTTEATTTDVTTTAPVP